MLTRAHLVILVLTIAGQARAAVIEHVRSPDEAAPRIGLGAPEDRSVSIAREVIDAREVGETTVITLSLELASSSLSSDTGQMTLALPRGASVVGLTFMRDGESLTAATRELGDAHQAFQQARVIKRDPALLEWTEESAMRLSVYPVISSEHPTATVTILVPQFRRLVVDVAGRHHELIGGTFAPPSDNEIAAAGLDPGVTSGVSLLAMPPPSLDDIDIHLANSTTEIHDCSVLASPDEPRDITLIVMIGADGRVVETSAGDTSAGACAARLASSWTFGAGDRPIAMHYRLHLPST